MTSRFTNTSRSDLRGSVLVGLTLTLLMGLGVPRESHAQGRLGPDPYLPYNSQYQSYVYPGFRPNPAFPNQAVLYGGEMGPYGATRRTPGGMVDYTPIDPYTGTPLLDPERGPARAGPQQAIDEEYQRRKREREELYFRALRERDPQRRAELLRLYRRAELEALRRRSEPQPREDARPRADQSGRAVPAGPGQPRTDRTDAPAALDPRRPGRLDEARPTPPATRSLRSPSVPSRTLDQRRVIERERRALERIRPGEPDDPDTEADAGAEELLPPLR